MGLGGQLPWRRDWSKQPNAWKTYLAFGVTWAALGVAYLIGGNLFGIAWLALASFGLLVSRYTFRAARRGRLAPQVRQSDGESR